VPNDEERARYATMSIWIALSRDKVMLDNLVTASRGEGDWQPLAPRTGFGGWSDDYASILPLLRPLPLNLFDWQF